jgi:hypothetical protein
MFLNFTTHAYFLFFYLLFSISNCFAVKSLNKLHPSLARVHPDPSKPLLIGYASWSQCDDSLLLMAKEARFNVLVW